MKQLKCHGHSDDTFGVYHGEGGLDGLDHDNCASGEAIIFKITSGDEGMLVYGQYDCDNWPRGIPGCWMVGVQQLDEGISLPWPMRYKHEGYTPVLIIDAPDDVEIVCLNLED